MNELIYYDEIAQALSKAAYHANANLKNMLGLLRMTLHDEMWRRRLVTVMGEVVEFNKFEDFVAAKPPQGLGMDVDTLKWLCIGDPELLEAVNAAQKSVSVKPKAPSPKLQASGDKLKRFSQEWTAQKLIEANQTELLQKLYEGKISPYAVQIEMGWRKKQAKTAAATLPKTEKSYRHSA